MTDATRIDDAGELLWLAPDECQPHPNNPRMALRDDVVQQIAFQLATDGFQPHHAITVRPLDDGYQIIAGHHRVAAAQQAEVEVAAWVVDMDDDTAFMQLILSNTQGELDPLERGMHALDYVDAYKNGGISAYAKRVGVTQASISQLRSAATVARMYNSSYTLLGKSKHLNEISKATEHAWPQLVDAMAEAGWSVKETAAKVQGLNAIEVPEHYAEWLTLERVTERYLDGRFSAKTVAKLVSAATQAEEWIRAYGTDEDLDNWHKWLPEAPFDPRPITDYHQTLIAGQFEVAGWHHGNWRDHLDELEDGSVSLVLTDPPYGVAYQSNYREERHSLIESDATPEQGAKELTAALEALYAKMSDNAHALIFTAGPVEHLTAQACEAAGLRVKSRLIWDKERTSMGDLEGAFAPRHERIIHAVKGTPKLRRRAPDVLTFARADSTRHPTEKPVELLTELIEVTTSTGQLVADPFGGVASTAVAAKDTARKWWSCELDDTYHALGEERLA